MAISCQLDSRPQKGSVPAEIKIFFPVLLSSIGCEASRVRFGVQELIGMSHPPSHGSRDALQSLRNHFCVPEQKALLCTSLFALTCHGHAVAEVTPDTCDETCFVSQEHSRSREVKTQLGLVSFFAFVSLLAAVCVFFVFPS